MYGVLLWLLPEHGRLLWSPSYGFAVPPGLSRSARRRITTRIGGDWRIGVARLATYPRWRRYSLEADARRRAAWPDWYVRR